MIRALVMESQRFMHYPAKAGGGGLRSRSTYNSRDIRPPSASPTPTPPTPPPPPPPQRSDESAKLVGEKPRRPIVWIFKTTYS